MSTPTTLPWLPDYVRVFLSHSAVYKQFTSEVAAALRQFGAHGFVAHEDMEVSQPWQEQIETALRSAEVLVALVHREFNESAWCQQKVGWAFGRDIPVLCIRIGADPRGFPGRTQWYSGFENSADDVAAMIGGWFNRRPTLSGRVASGLIKAPEQASDYWASDAAAKALVNLGDLTPEQWDAVDRAFLANDQVHGGFMARKALKPMYDHAPRSFPTGSA